MASLSDIEKKLKGFFNQVTNPQHITRAATNIGSFINPSFKPILQSQPVQNVMKGMATGLTNTVKEGLPAMYRISPLNPQRSPLKIQNGKIGFNAINTPLLPQIKQDLTDTIKVGKLAATAYGVPKLGAANLAITGGLSGLFNKIGGGSFSEGVGQGFANAPVLSGIGSVTNPTITKIANNVAGKVGGKYAPAVVNRLTTGALNVPEGVVMKGSLTNQAYGAGDALMDFGIGTLTGSPINTASKGMVMRKEYPQIMEKIQDNIKNVIARYEKTRGIGATSSSPIVDLDLADDAVNLWKTMFGDKPLPKGFNGVDIDRVVGDIFENFQGWKAEKEMLGQGIRMGIKNQSDAQAGLSDTKLSKEAKIVADNLSGYDRNEFIDEFYKEITSADPARKARADKVLKEITDSGMTLDSFYDKYNKYPHVAQESIPNQSFYDTKKALEIEQDIQRNNVRIQQDFMDGKITQPQRDKLMSENLSRRVAQESIDDTGLVSPRIADLKRQMMDILQNGQRGTDGQLTPQFRQQVDTITQQIRQLESQRIDVVNAKPGIPGKLPENVMKITNESQFPSEAQLKGQMYQDIPKSDVPPGASKPEVPDGQKERKFIETVREADVTKQEVAEKVKGFYTPETNAEQIKRAQYAIDTNYDVAKQRVSKEPLSADTNAIGLEIMRRAQDAGRYNEAIEMAELLARKGTEAGRAVQAFSIWARLTPEGMLKYAQKEILSANEKLGIISKTLRNTFGKGEVKLTDQDAKVITKLMEQANATTDEIQRSKLIKQAFEYIGKKIPWGASDLIDEYRYNNMLSNPLTHLRNAWSNLLQTYLTRPATLAAQGKLTDAAKYEVAAVKALPDALANFVQAFKEGNIAQRISMDDVSKMKPIKPSRIPPLLGVPSRLLQASDSFFSTIIKQGEMARGATDIEATNIAEYSLFRQGLNSKDQGILLNKIDNVTKAMYGLRKVGLGWFIPFIQTPMNAAKQWIEYSPAGLATIPGAANKKEQLAKTMIGSMVTLIGANYALQNKTTWAAPTDPEQKKLFYDSGRKPYSVKIGDKWIPMQTFGVYAWALGIPAAYKYYNDESRSALTDTQLDKLINTSLSLGGFWSNQTFVSGLGSFVNLAEGDTDYSVSKNIGFTLGQLKPMNGLLRYVSTIIDPIYRKPRDIGEQLISDVPYLTKKLDSYETTLGEPAVRNISNYIAPYAQGQANSEYEDLYQMRKEQLQQNAVLNKMEKDLERQTSTGILDQALASEDDSQLIDPNQKRQELMDKMQLDMATKKVKITGQAQNIGSFYIYKNENGGTSKINTDFSINKPELTGNAELDKKLISGYNSDVNSKIKNAVKLYELGQISAEEANNIIMQLNGQKTTGGKTKKAKKITISKVSVPKVKFSAPKRSSAFKGLKMPNITSSVKIKASKPKNIKISTPTKSFSYKVVRPKLQGLRMGVKIA